MDQGLSHGERVQGLVDAALAARGAGPAAPQASLRDTGLTSMEVVNLMMAVEDAFGLVLPESEMTPDNFHSVATIEALVSRLV